MEVAVLEVGAAAVSVEGTDVGASVDELVEVATLEVGATADLVEETGDGVSAPHAESNSVRAPNKVKGLVFIIG